MFNIMRFINLRFSHLLYFLITLHVMKYKLKKYIRPHLYFFTRLQPEAQKILGITVSNIRREIHVL